MSSSPSLSSFTFYYYPFYFSFHLSFTLTIHQAKLISIPKNVPASQKTQHITVTKLISLRPTTKTAALHPITSSPSLQLGGARDSHCPYTVNTLRAQLCVSMLSWGMTPLILPLNTTEKWATSFRGLYSSTWCQHCVGLPLGDAFYELHCKNTWRDVSKATPLSTAWRHKLLVAQLLTPFSVSYGTRMFITAFTSVRHLSQFWARLSLYTPYQKMRFGYAFQCRTINTYVFQVVSFL